MGNTFSILVFVSREGGMISQTINDWQLSHSNIVPVVVIIIILQNSYNYRKNKHLPLNTLLKYITFRKNTPEITKRTGQKYKLNLN